MVPSLQHNLNLICSRLICFNMPIDLLIHSYSNILRLLYNELQKDLVLGGGWAGVGRGLDGGWTGEESMLFAKFNL